MVGLGTAFVLCPLAGACGPPAMVNLPGVATEVPATLVKALDDRWPDARVVDAATAPAECAGRRLPSPAAVVSGDFNGDSLTDYALRLHTGERVAVVAGLARFDGDFVIHVLTADAEPAGVLDLGRRGDSHRSSDTGIAEFFGVDTVALTRCGDGATGFFWTGASFGAREIE